MNLSYGTFIFILISLVERHPSLSFNVASESITDNTTVTDNLSFSSTEFSKKALLLQNYTPSSHQEPVVSESVTTEALTTSHNYSLSSSRTTAYTRDSSTANIYSVMTTQNPFISNASILPQTYFDDLSNSKGLFKDILNISTSSPKYNYTTEVLTKTSTSADVTNVTQPSRKSNQKGEDQWAKTSSLSKDELSTMSAAEVTPAPIHLSTWSQSNQTALHSNNTSTMQADIEVPQNGTNLGNNLTWVLNTTLGPLVTEYWPTVTDFYSNTTVAEKNGLKLSTPLIIGIAVGSATLLIILCVVTAAVCHRQNRKKLPTGKLKMHPRHSVQPEQYPGLFDDRDDIVSLSYINVHMARPKKTAEEDMISLDSDGYLNSLENPMYDSHHPTPRKPTTKV